ncbi:hypothetical protein PAI11_07020 [Patulibacter medicamentivorans]|uniref:Uncharacterized protein n=1 Tax=Patulibacter medicamentivorans TaxID=1097667 RepID=H0E1P0_9ACTN|nr:hypothetical protein PAI11_07020 [Patulibacter medicamentivorans]
MTPGNESPNIPTLPVDHGWRAAHSTAAAPSVLSLGARKSNVPCEQPVPRTATPTTA